MICVGIKKDAPKKSVEKANYGPRDWGIIINTVYEMCAGKETSSTCKHWILLS